MLKQEKGVTLVALIITIIILLILAGISVAALMGGDGIFRRADQARERTEVGKNEESNFLVNAEQYLNYYAD